MAASQKLPTFVVCLFACVPFALRAEPTQRKPGEGRQVDRGSKHAPPYSYGKLPLSFEANEGQADSAVQFLSHGSGYGLYLTRAGAVLTLRGRTTDTRASLGLEAPHGVGQDSSTVVFRFLGANRAVRIEGRDELPGKSNYLIGNDPSRWRTNLPTYRNVEYRNIYDGIDLLYYGNQRQLESDFVVRAGAKPRAIAIAIEGADRLFIDGRGDLVISTREGQVRLQKPIAYQEVNGMRKQVAASYRIERRHRVSFELGAYDRAEMLVIDPLLSYSTFLGGDGSDAGNAIAVDSTGSAFVTGETFSRNFPTTAGARQSNLPGPHTNAFVSKLSPDGSSLVYSTYLGGRGGLGGTGDSGSGIAVDPAGCAYVAGTTDSADFPVTAGSFQTTYGGSVFDGFVTKLTADGSSLVYSTFLGGNEQDTAAGIAVDSDGYAYVTGYTDSSDFPTTAGAFQTIPAGTSRAFVTKLNLDGSALVYSTYISGAMGVGIAIDSGGLAYVTGFAFSGFPTTSGAFQTTSASGLHAFVSKLNGTGSSLLYSTYLGGSQNEGGFGIAVNSGGSALVTGYTYSTDFPTTVGALQRASGGGREAFVTKLSADGSSAEYSTYLGGTGDDAGFAIALDASGSAYVAGVTTSPDFPVTPGAFQTSLGGYAAAFMTRLNAAGSSLAYSTYLGGSGGAEAHGIAVDSAGLAYVSGFTDSADFPATPGVSQTTFGGGESDAFVTRLRSLAPPGPPRNVRVQPGNGFVNVSWDPPASDGGSPIASYTVVSSSEAVFTVPGTQLSVTAPGLIADCFSQYQFNVYATNSIGNGTAAQSQWTRPSGIVSAEPPQVAFVLLDGAPSEERGGAYYPIPVENPDDGVPIVSSYCPTELNGNVATFPLGLVDNLYRWDEFPVWNSGTHGVSGLFSRPQSGDACLTADGHCLTVPLAAQGAVLFPYSYRGAAFTTDSSGTARAFTVSSYGYSDSGGGDPAQHVELLQQEITSIHAVWPRTRIALIGHSYGGLVAEQWWEKYWLSSDGEGVVYVFTLDSPVNGIGATFAPKDVSSQVQVDYGSAIVNLWHLLWTQKIPRDKILIAADQKASLTLRTIGTADDATYTYVDPDYVGLASQVLGFRDGTTWQTPTPASYSSPCSASVPIDGINGHDTVKVCTPVIEYIAGLVGVR